MRGWKKKYERERKKRTLPFEESDRVCWLVGVRDLKPGLVALFPTHSRSQNKRKVSFFGGGRKRTELKRKK